MQCQNANLELFPCVQLFGSYIPIYISKSPELFGTVWGVKTNSCDIVPLHLPYICNHTLPIHLNKLWLKYILLYLELHVEPLYAILIYQYEETSAFIIVYLNMSSLQYTFSALGEIIIIIKQDGGIRTWATTLLT